MLSYTLRASPRILLRACSQPPRGRGLASFSSETIRQDNVGTKKVPIPEDVSVPKVSPRPSVDIKGIRSNVEVHRRNCENRRYYDLAPHPKLIEEKHTRIVDYQKSTNETRQELKASQQAIANAPDDQKHVHVERARSLRESTDIADTECSNLSKEIFRLAIKMPNLMSEATPLEHPRVVRVVQPEDRPANHYRDHVRIGTRLGILDFGSAVSTSGWGFYFFLDEAEELEHALVQYARGVVKRHGYQLCTPPSLVYTDMRNACGFRPRDNQDSHSYDISKKQHSPEEASESFNNQPNLSLAATAEIPIAAMKAQKTFRADDLPRRVAGSSRCYRAEAGARGRDARGLYRVHEFTKVEMFAWTLPHQEEAVFEEMVGIQEEIISSLELPYRILEMPAPELGATAFRKQDIEVYFPSRSDINGGWGEVTSTSMCTDYQTRRLNTRFRDGNGELKFASTVNGTAMAVPRIVAAILEKGWVSDELILLPWVLR